VNLREILEIKMSGSSSKKAAQRLRKQQEKENETSRHISPTVTPEGKVKSVKSPKNKKRNRAQAQVDAEAQADAEASYDPAPEEKKDDEERVEQEEGEEEEEKSESETDLDDNVSGYNSDNDWVSCSTGVKVVKPKPKGDHHDASFNPEQYGCKGYMTKQDVMDSQQSDLKILADKVRSLEGMKPTVVLSNTKHYILRPKNIGAEGLKCLCDSIEDAGRNNCCSCAYVDTISLRLRLDSLSSGSKVSSAKQHHAMCNGIVTVVVCSRFSLYPDICVVSSLVCFG
jgi:hypothetical protein